MRHPLNWLARVERPPAEAQALLGDLEEEYRAITSRNPGRWRLIAAQAWYARQLFSAVGFAMTDNSADAPSLPPTKRTIFRLRVIPDIRYALRRWRRRPAFAATAILTLALGIAAATAIFSIVDAVLLRPLPWAKPESLVVIHGVYPERRSNPATATTWNRGDFSYPVWDAIRTMPTFESVGAWRTLGRNTWTLGGDRTQLLDRMDVSSNFLSTLGVPMAMGRSFNEREDNVPSDSIVVSHAIWQERLSGRSDVVGSQVTIGRADASTNNDPHTVIGVLPPGFQFQGFEPHIIGPIGISAAANRQYFSGSLRLVGRLAPGVAREAAESAAAPLVTAADTSVQVSARLVPIIEEQLGPVAPSLWLLFGGAGLLLLVACTNVAGLLLGEARVRRHEIAVRAALGGTRMRVMRQLFVEHTLMAVVGAALGVLFAHWMVGAIIAIAPEGLPRLDTVRIDMRVVGFAMSCALLTLLLFGIAPAFSLARTPVARVLSEGGRDGAAGRILGQRAIVVAEIALALVLLTGAHLFGETILRLTSQPLGFQPEGLAVLSTTFTGSRFDMKKVQAAMADARAGRSPGTAVRDVLDRSYLETSSALTDRILARLATVPGVSASAGASAMPFVSNPSRVPVVLEGRPDAERHDALRQSVTSGYFDTMRMQLRDGHSFGPEDAAPIGGDADRASVVSAEFQRRFFPDGAVGRRFRYVYGGEFEQAVRYRIIGVVADVKRQEFTDDDRPAFYVSDRQSGGLLHYVARTTGDVTALLPALRQAIIEVAPDMVVTASVPAESRVARSIAEERFRATLSSLFGGAALLLAAVGLYGLVTRRAADRRREFGVRVALGARPSDVGRLVVRDAALIIGFGLLVGLPAAYAAAQVTGSLLFGVTPSSPHVFALTSTVLALVALMATMLPARRASKADPILALKE